MQRLDPQIANTNRISFTIGSFAVMFTLSSAHAWQFRDVTAEHIKLPAPSAESQPAEKDSSVTQLSDLNRNILEPRDTEADSDTPGEVAAEDVGVNNTDEDSNEALPLETAKIPKDQKPGQRPAGHSANDSKELVDLKNNLPLESAISTDIIDSNTNENHTTKDVHDSDPDSDNPNPIRPMRFNGLLVGHSTADELATAWGKSFKTTGTPHNRTVKYRIEPFRQVDVTLVDEVVTSILIHLTEPLQADHCAAQLGLSNLTVASVPNGDGGVLGLLFPERGVVFSNVFDDPASMVDKIQLETPTADSFVMRAEHDVDNHFEDNLRDVEQALQMDPEYARAHHVKAGILMLVGRYHDALEAAEQASQLDPKSNLYLLRKAELLSLNGSYESALRLLKGVVAIADLDDTLRALGELLLGDLIAKGPTPRFKESLKHHLRAIELAAPFANDLNVDDRHRAKQILLQSHLGVARDISRGKFQQQQEVVPKWLHCADALAEDMIQREQADSALRLKVHATRLATLVDLHSLEDPWELIQDALTAGRQLVNHTDDPLNFSRLNWQLGAVLAESIQLLRLQGDLDKALELTDEALGLLKESALQRQSTPAQKYVVGQLYFHVGSLSAVRDKDHESAVVWYEMAQPLLLGDLPVSILANPGSHGESFVSMGVSYWKLNRREKAIDLTEQGADILQQAVVDGILEPQTLSIPYRNLANMHQLAGNEDDAKAFLELAASLKTKPSHVVAH